MTTNEQGASGKRKRATGYTELEIKQEAEANAFAAALLMPEEMFLAEYDKLDELNEEERVKSLAKIFEVPEWAVIMRIHQLKKAII